MAYPEILVLRHGQTEWNRIGRMQGDLDSPLTPLGMAQARAQADLLAAAGVAQSSHRAYCSPKGRATATAALALPEGAKPVLDPRLAEISMGLWTGLTRAEIIAATPGLSHASGMIDFYAAVPGKDRFAPLRARCTAFLDELDGPTVIITHGITSRMLRGIAAGRDIGELPGGQGVVFRVRNGQHETLRP